MQAPEPTRIKLPPEQIATMLYRRFCREPARHDMASKKAAMGVVLAATVSLPVLTIATRDRIEAEMKARRQADLNRAEAELAAALMVGSSISPETLDG